MAQVTFRFLRPNDLFGRMIAWRLAEPYCHAVIIIGDEAYSSTFPTVKCYPITHRDVAMPPRNGLDMVMDLTDKQVTELRYWCDKRVGTRYDIMSILGWILFRKEWNDPKTTYCYEFCYEALVALGLVPETRDLVSSEALMLVLYKLGAR